MEALKIALEKIYIDDLYQFQLETPRMIDDTDQF